MLDDKSSPKSVVKKEELDFDLGVLRNKIVDYSNSSDIIENSKHDYSYLSDLAFFLFPRINIGEYLNYFVNLVKAYLEGFYNSVKDEDIFCEFKKLLLGKLGLRFKDLPFFAGKVHIFLASKSRLNQHQKFELCAIERLLFKIHLREMIFARK